MKAVVTAVLLVAAIVLFAVGWRETWRAREEAIARNEKSAGAHLYLFRALQADYRAQTGGYWTGDVTGLVSERLKLGGPRFPRAETLGFGDWQGLLNADPSRPGATPCQGYWFVAMTTDLDGRTLTKDRYAFCAYPAEYDATGRRTYVTDDETAPTRRDLKGAPVLQWLSDMKLRDWSCGIDD